MSVMVIGRPDSADLTRAAARDLTDLARIALGNAAEWASKAAEYIREAWAQRADKALGYESWADYCAVEFAAVRGLRVPVPTRIEAVAALSEAGMSGRGIAAAYGLDEATVRVALKASRAPLTLVPEPAPEVAPTKGQRVLEALAAAGTKGMTTPELTALARRRKWDGAWYHGPASSVLSRLRSSGKVTQTLQTRGGFSVYLHADHA